MADIPGKNVTLLIEDSPGAGTYTVIAGATSHTMTINNTEVDVSTKDSGGWRDIFPEGSIKSISISGTFRFENSTDQGVVKALANSTSNPAANFKFRDGSGNEWVGEFQLSTYETGGETEGFASMGITLSSNGTITYQAVP